MKTKSFHTVLIAVFAALCLFCPAAVFAQKDKEQAMPEKALETLRKHEIPAAFYERLQAQENGWLLARFFPPHPTDDDYKKTYGLDFQKENTKVRIFIYEYATAAKAAEFSVLNVHISSGIVKEYTQYGDEGRKIYGNRRFSSLSFRKNRFVVSILCDDEKTAERFAGYASDALNSRINIQP